jgi:hypothetical protein
MELQHPHLQGYIIFIRRYLYITEYDMRYCLAFPLVGARAGACTTLATGYIYPRDWDALELITPLPRCNVDIV